MLHKREHNWPQWRTPGPKESTLHDTQVLQTYIAKLTEVAELITARSKMNIRNRKTRFSHPRAENKFQDSMVTFCDDSQPNKDYFSMTASFKSFESSINWLDEKESKQLLHARGKVLNNNYLSIRKYNRQSVLMPTSYLNKEQFRLPLLHEVDYVRN